MTQQDNGIPGPLEVRRAVTLPAADPTAAWAALVPGGAAATAATAAVPVVAEPESGPESKPKSKSESAAGGGRRGKGLLIAAAIAGVALLSSPLLFIGGDDGEARASGASPRPTAEAAPTEEAADESEAPAEPTPAESAEPTDEPVEPSTPPETEAPPETPAEAEAEAPAEDADEGRPDGPGRGDWGRPGGQSPDGEDLTDSSGVVLYHVGTGRCAGSGGNGGPALVECGGSSFGAMLWDLTVRQRDAGPGGAELFTLAGTGGGSCLEPAGGQVGAGPCHASGGQLWWLDEQGGGGSRIRNSGGDQCLGGEGDRLTVVPCGSGNDLWALAGLGGGDGRR
ncbi:RICIN domain-containing protein [Streptomyces radicis]|uniref:Uncharacterized protein n=1 Tax=Streptomyces radicis TaxID=1750517 RepID=A0A3A9VV09_9ACTN|nr:hypothetical protein [Streptomyces radicis]RKN04738.1 hypothetical protein D7319_27295 [Streptomyces radicis]RKN15944.1 hypothetical protein D7318_26340 [Streptomyces radicis]